MIQQTTNCRLTDTNRRPGLRGFTVIEVLIVIFISSLLMSLLLPAVQAARESARRVSCGNNLRQLGIGIRQHHDVAHTLPISVGPWREGPNPARQRDGRGWILSSLPFLEQEGFYNEFRLYLNGDFLSGGGLRNPACRQAMKTQLEVLHCPSDDSVLANSMEQWQWEGIEVALTSYKGVIGDNRMGGDRSMHLGSEPDCLRTGRCNGLFYRLTYQRPVRFADIHDGAGNTFMVGEDVVAENYHSTAYYANGDYASCHAPLNFFPEPPRPRDWWDVMSFRSNHSNGANFCYADGSVHFLDDDIHYPVYRALSTRNGNESTSR